MSRQENPFAGKYPGMPNVQAVDAESRKRMVANFSVDECRRALHLRGLQKTVASAVERRLKRLGAAKTKEGAA